MKKIIILLFLAQSHKMYSQNIEKTIDSLRSLFDIRKHSTFLVSIDSLSYKSDYLKGEILYKIQHSKLFNYRIILSNQANEKKYFNRKKNYCALFIYSNSSENNIIGNMICVNKSYIEGNGLKMELNRKYKHVYFTISLNTSELKITSTD